MKNLSFLKLKLHTLAEGAPAYHVIKTLSTYFTYLNDLIDSVVKNAKVEAKNV